MPADFSFLSRRDIALLFIINLFFLHIKTMICIMRLCKNVNIYWNIKDANVEYNNVL